MVPYILFITTILLSVAQVSLASFMMIGGVAVPIAAIAVWLISRNRRNGLYYALVAGLTIDLLSPSLFGVYTCAMVCVYALNRIIRERLGTHTILNSVLSLGIGLLGYLLIVRLLTAW